MSLDKISKDKKSNIRKKPRFERAESRHEQQQEPAPPHHLMALQNQVGNQVVQAMLAQRQGGEAFDLDDNTAEQINHERGSGQPLDSNVQEQMGTALGQDFSNVKVHTSSEADTLNQQLGAKAFTTGQDIFFQKDAYQPQSSAGQELLAHELTHVAQQSAGMAGSGGNAMKVNAPDDAYEQEADAVAQAVTSPDAEVQQAAAEGGMIARQEEPEEEEEIRMKADDTIQRQAEMEEEEEIRMKADDAIQRQEEPEEEEEIQMKADDAIQRQEEPEEEEEIRMKADDAIQRQEEPEEEEEIQMKADDTIRRDVKEA